ncbi:hypothetical protein [Sphingobacterium faecale]|uniref:Uncharacterized protein n=1 Tax=Sphingobacterium faecale TaxID=2803775 RepID=A0ABS1R8J8_9SPHI|nr:hypothetical protein [Sphingobacterium faecale]MBL1411008.1 hypothetical protein [Sphingobacterium faecale]
MAKSKDNLIMQGTSGRVGRNLVFRLKGDQTIIAKRARQKTNREYSSDQQSVMNKFTRAALYAKAAIQDPQLKQAYQAKANVNQTAYNVAFRDYLVKPYVALLDDMGYQGNAGEKISLLIKDVLQVVNVKIEVLNANDVVVESGAATVAPLDTTNTHWNYTMTEENPDYENSKYRITLTDTPGKKAVEIKDYGEDATAD